MVEVVLVIHFKYAAFNKKNEEEWRILAVQIYGLIPNIQWILD